MDPPVKPEGDEREGGRSSRRETKEKGGGQAGGRRKRRRAVKPEGDESGWVERLAWLCPA